MPSSASAVRFPTILANLGGQGSLAGNLAVELYSAAMIICWGSRLEKTSYILVDE